MTTLRTTTKAILLVLLTAASSLAGPPLFTDDAATVDVGKVEVELNGAYARDKETTAGVTTKSEQYDAEMKFTTGLYKTMGISLAIPYTISDRNKEDGQLAGKAEGFGDMILEIKYAFAEVAGTTFAIKTSAKMPTGKSSEALSEGSWQLGTTLIATMEFKEGTYAVHANLGYENHSCCTDAISDSTPSDLLTGSIGGEAEVMKGLAAVVDFGLATSANRSTPQLSANALTGARYEINDHLDINAGIRLGLIRPEDGISIRYGLTMKF